jgi:membrane fusion protein (multidrug efflux system)
VVLKAWVPNEHGRLRAGLFANVELEIDRREGALLVPESALVYDRKGTYVWRDDGEGRATRVPIEIGLRRRGMVEVSLGLRGGDRIVSAGTHKVSEGDTLAAKDVPNSGQALRDMPADAAGGEGT